MKKLFAVIAFVSAISLSAFAQDRENRDADGKIVRGPYVRNSFFDNTFVQLQGGVNIMGAPKMGQGAGWSSLKPGVALDVNLGKWFNPNFGLRLGWQGLKTAYMPGSTMVREKNQYNYTHADFLVNISNWFSGYRDRVWDFAPYVHVGWINTPAYGYETVLNKPGAGAGLLNLVRLSERIKLTIDLRATMCTNAVLGTTYVNHRIADCGRDTFGEKLGGVASALVGLQVNFGKTGWERGENAKKSAAPAVAAAAAAGVVFGEYIGAAKKDEKLQALQAKADEQVASSNAAYAKASADYEKAQELVNADGMVAPAVYADVDPALAAAYADMANFEDCPDFASMTKAEKDAWTKSHKDILPANWKKMSDAEKTAWVVDTIYAPAQVAVDDKESVTGNLGDARDEVKAANATCNDAVALAQWFVDDAAKRIDANGNVLPAAYPGVDAATAQKYADIANSEAFPDFTKMSNKEKRAWNKAHKDILPKNWKKLSDEQKNDWLIENIYGPKFQAQADAEAAAEELAKAQARKAAEDKAYEEAMKNLDKAVESDGVGYFTIGKSVFNEKQLANWKKSIKKYDKAGDYTVTGYADNETGTAARNAELRKERAEYVANLLKENGFTGVITPVPASTKEKFVNYPIWKNRSALIK